MADKLTLDRRITARNYVDYASHLNVMAVDIQGSGILVTTPFHTTSATSNSFVVQVDDGPLWMCTTEGAGAACPLFLSFNQSLRISCSSSAASRIAHAIILLD